jgi:hypothetical protein
MSENAESEAAIEQMGGDETLVKRGLATDIAIAVGPTAAVATGWALDHFGGANKAPQEEAPKITLPPGAKVD